MSALIDSENPTNPGMLSLLFAKACRNSSEESEEESCEHQDNTNIHCQPFPKPICEEREIYAHYGSCHR
jgi:hypothetical protein